MTARNHLLLQANTASLLCRSVAMVDGKRLLPDGITVSICSESSLNDLSTSIARNPSFDPNPGLNNGLNNGDIDDSESSLTTNDQRVSNCSYSDNRDTGSYHDHPGLRTEMTAVARSSTPRISRWSSWCPRAKNRCCPSVPMINAPARPRVGWSVDRGIRRGRRPARCRGRAGRRRPESRSRCR